MTQPTEQARSPVRWHTVTRLRAGRIVPIICWFIFFSLALDTALSKTPTADEPVHVLRGLTLWQTRDLSLQTQPPLSHWLIGSLVSTDPESPQVTHLGSWSTGDRPVIAHELFWEIGLPVERIMLLARFPIILLGMLLSAMLARWARELGDRSAQNVLLFLFSLSPNVLASASLATTDLTVTATYSAAVFTWWFYWRKQSRQRWLGAALCLGLALGAKLTALLLLPITLVLGYTGSPRSRPWWRAAAAWVSLLPITGLALWALYGFEVRQTLSLPFPIPAATYLDNFLRVQEHVTEGHLAYLLGSLSRDGWWYYFVVALLIKTPLPTLILTLSAAVWCIYRRRWRRDAFLWVPAGALLLVASYTRLNIGYRHILPALPFLMVWGAGWAANALRKRYWQACVVILFAWYGLGALHQHPHHLAYFNELVGGSEQGYHYLGDSNLDWGQDLETLAEYISRSGSQSVFVSYFGAADPSSYGLDTDLLLVAADEISADFEPANPSPGLYAVSANHLQGITLSEPDLYDWFRRQEPLNQIGYSILVYQVVEQATGTWIAHCLDPAPLLDQETAAHLVGQTQIRHVYFDCHTSWVFPNNAQAGWFVVPQQAEAWPLLSQFPNNLRVVYSHSATRDTPSYEVHYWNGRIDPSAQLITGSSAIVGEDNVVAVPVAIGETLQLEGYRADGQNWWTVWRVLSQAQGQLSIAAHLYTAAPSPAVADGLGFSSDQWQPGDVFVQIHRFNSTEHAFYLETGIYNYLTGERLPISAESSGAGALRLYPNRKAAE